VRCSPRRLVWAGAPGSRQTDRTGAAAAGGGRQAGGGHGQGGAAHISIDPRALRFVTVLHGATLLGVPTTRPRHTITETPAVREALDELRARLAGERVDYAELVVLGARTKARQLPDDAGAARAAVERLAERVRRREVPVDLDAADEVKRLGLIAG
jgi:hypothetical protein